MADNTTAVRQARQRDRDRAVGIKEVTVKVPENRMADIRRIATQMREEAKKQPDEVAPIIEQEA